MYLKLQPDFNGLVPSGIDKFSIYKNFKIPLTPISPLSKTSIPGSTPLHFDKVWATLLTHGQQTTTCNVSDHAKFDTVLVKMANSAGSECMEGTSLMSELTVLCSITSMLNIVVELCAAQVRIIFNLLQHFLQS
jgi:hypothetical protein